MATSVPGISAGRPWIRCSQEESCLVQEDCGEGTESSSFPTLGDMACRISFQLVDGSSLESTSFPRTATSRAWEMEGKPGNCVPLISPQFSSVISDDSCAGTVCRMSEQNPDPSSRLIHPKASPLFHPIPAFGAIDLFSGPVASRNPRSGSCLTLSAEDVDGGTGSVQSLRSDVSSMVDPCKAGSSHLGLCSPGFGQICSKPVFGRKVFGAFSSWRSLNKSGQINSKKSESSSATVQLLHDSSHKALVEHTNHSSTIDNSKDASSATKGNLNGRQISRIGRCMDPGTTMRCLDFGSDEEIAEARNRIEGTDNCVPENQDISSHDVGSPRSISGPVGGNDLNFMEAQPSIHVDDSGIVVVDNEGVVIPTRDSSNTLGTEDQCGAFTHIPDKSLQTVGWKRRHIVNSGPNSREYDPKRHSALQKAVLKFADRNGVGDYVIDPAVGTEFDSCQEAFEYYNLYSWERGFGIRRGKRRYSETASNRLLPKEEKYAIGQDFHCSCSGSPNNEIKTVSIRKNCPAMLRLHRTSDYGWVVADHIAEHNHGLSTTYADNKLWSSHSHLDKYTTELVKKLRENNTNLTKIYTILGSFFGGMEKVPTTKRCLKALCQKINSEDGKDDIAKTLRLFREFMEKDPGFTYVVDPDEDGRIKSLMWTNSRSRMQYAHFGDVVTFDTTYKTNLYDMPFGLFVGVNNHFQTVFFGGVLLTDETVDSFKWVFSQFVTLMGGKAPKTILTDQARAMEVAISEVWRETVHRWCKWHVIHRLKERLGVKYSKDKIFRQKFHKLLNDMLTVDEFEKGWHDLLDDHGLQDNAFMRQIFDVRKMWVKCFFKDVFCARQTSTQRSESANHMLKGIVQKSCSIHRFVEQYAKLQYLRDEEETQEERRTNLKSRNTSIGGPLVVDASKLYTAKVYEMFCELKEQSEDYRVIVVEPEVEYIAEHYDLSRVERWFKGTYRVSVDQESRMYKCECGLFEHFGLPCPHALRVMISCGVKKIPEIMVIQRWTRGARNIAPDSLSQYNKENLAAASQTYRHSKLWTNALEIVEMGDSNPESYKVAMDIFFEGKKRLVEVSKTKDGLGLGHNSSSGVACEENPIPEVHLQAPRKRPRGRPTTARDRAGYENLTRRTRHCTVCRSPHHTRQNCTETENGNGPVRKPPTCSRCGLSGHNRSGCVSQAQQLVVASKV